MNPIVQTLSNLDVNSRGGWKVARKMASKIALIMLILTIGSVQGFTYDNFKEFVLGFFTGADFNPCINSPCETQDIPTFIYKLDHLYSDFLAAWNPLYTGCNLQTPIDDFKNIETNDGLKAAFLRVFYDIGSAITVYQSIFEGTCY